MKMRACIVLWLMLPTAIVRADDVLDRVEDALSWSAPGGQSRARLSGTLDAEGYALPDPAPGVIDAGTPALFTPRLSVYLDAQIGERLYAFAQARADRGFDPSIDPLTARLDEYALRFAAVPHGRLNVQVGKFATVVGNWTERHGSWTNPFITAPLPYENLTGVWDTEPPHSVGQLLVWSHVRPGLPTAIVEDEKYLRLPIVWGPSYATGAAVAGEWDRFRYAIEVKNATLSSRPQRWTWGEEGFDHPTVSARLRFLPDESWDLGMSFSSGAYLRPSAEPLLPRGARFADYRETVLGQDMAFAWHHFQFWAELYEARFAIPLLGNADTFAYYTEMKYKFTAQFFGALRWNQQIYGTMNGTAGSVRWGRNVWRIDVAPTYRLTPHFQLKLQYSFENGATERHAYTQLLAGQATVRF